MLIPPRNFTSTPSTSKNRISSDKNNSSSLDFQPKNSSAISGQALPLCLRPLPIHLSQDILAINIVFICYYREGELMNTKTRNSKMGQAQVHGQTFLSAHSIISISKRSAINNDNSYAKFFKSTWSRFYITHLHNPSVLTTHSYKPITILDNGKHALWPLHFRKKRGIIIGIRDTKTAPRNPSGWIFHAVSIYHGIRIPFIWYSPTKDVGKIGERSIGFIVCICNYLDYLIFQKDKLLVSSSKRKNKMARLLEM
ncbi:hypothetical protein G9A89_003550 [Geosiphon pyriformis]|nr:hypothetical protein G9A89_003550 [Geosiphon pyriformis]